ncbi:hypothetical protein CPB83DRAFT_854953 [Crepidotus variabilis]|uniref:Uncharacterized protein n=1 Tax=Crepidotus variabilis TaxID=179855 RepID=A0A9P6EEN5_9AGAR|nr:hypothetical protein CPB83DRAFT_854953 [Crepidotus variabilis]
MTTINAPPHTSSIDETTIKKVAELKVLDSKKGEVRFGSLFEEQKTVVIFIRHFFCGSCQAYITQLCNLVSDEALEKAGTRVVLVGSGETEAFDHFREMTGFKGNIYTNPSRDLFRAFGMTTTTQTTPAGETRKSYLTSTKTQVVLNSLWDIAKKPYLFFAKTGNLSQNGGELILGPGLQCSFASIMQHSEDHTELVDLMRVAGVQIAS